MASQRAVGSTLLPTTYSSPSFEEIESVAVVAPDDVVADLHPDGARLTGRQRPPGAEVLAGSQEGEIVRPAQLRCEQYACEGEDEDGGGRGEQRGFRVSFGVPV